jgi:NAD(P)-dependent dehydrogenase (short-subunit alcohol dehydrogenase family)
MAQTLKLRGEPITVNCLCPGVVPTGLMPQTIVDSMPREMVTWVSTMVKAINAFLADDSITGQAAECSGEDVIYRQPYEPENEAARYMLSGKWIENADGKEIKKHVEEKVRCYNVMEGVEVNSNH